MSVQRFLGMSVLRCKPKPSIKRPSQWLGGREKRYVLAVPQGYVYVCYLPFIGVFPVAFCQVLTNDLAEYNLFVDVRSKAMKRLSIGSEVGGILPLLSKESKLFGKLPHLVEFLVATTYEDGTPRAPGRLWFDQDGIAFTITLFEPTGFARMRLRANTLDDVWMLAEKALAAENAPWEADQYAREKAAIKKKK